MATLTDKVFAITRNLTARIYVNGVMLAQANPNTSSGVPGWNSLEISKSIDSPVPTLNIGINKCPSWIKRGHKITVDLGYDDITQTSFTGYTQARNPNFPAAGLIGAGMLYTAYRTVCIPERDMSGKTVAVGLGDILTYAGIADYNIDVPAYTLPAVDAKLDRQPASQMLQALMDIDGCRIWETGSGTVYIRQTDELPSGSGFTTYTTTNMLTARILRGTNTEMPDYLKTRMVVTGATIKESVYPTETTRTITSTAILVSCPLVQPPLPAGSYIDSEFSSNFIADDTKAQEVARRLLTKYARVPRELMLDIPLDPRIEIGMTVALDFPEEDATGNWFVYGLQHSVSQSGARTQLRLRGGGEYGGTVKLSPVADFKVSIEREVFGGLENVVVTFNANSSYDPDGAIASYAWTDNEITTPEVDAQTGPLFTVVGDPAGMSGWEVELTVTDSDGLTGKVKKTIAYEASSADVHIPVIFAAIDNNASVTPDGGATWNDEAGAGCISVAAKPPSAITTGAAVFGYSSGVIKLCTDGLVSPMTTVYTGASPINHLAWDVNLTNFVWAVTEAGDILLSRDDGATWEVYSSLAIKLNRIMSLAGWGIMVLGEAIMYDRHLTNAWVTIPYPGSAGTFVVDGAMAEANELCVILSDGGIFHTSTVYGAPAWQAAVGPPTNIAGRYCVRDLSTLTYHAAFANRSVWHTIDGVNWTQTANVLPANGDPHYALWLGAAQNIPGLSGVYLIAVEDTVGKTFGIYKSADGLKTAAPVRPAGGSYPPWPATAIGRMIAIGLQAVQPGDILVQVAISIGALRHILKREKGIWALQHSDAAPSDFSRLVKLGTRHWRAGGAQYQDTLAETAEYSDDKGVTWTPVAALANCWDINIAANGNLWAICREVGATMPPLDDVSIIKTSDDNGATWTESTRINWVFPHTRPMDNIACHPTDAGTIAVIGHRYVDTQIHWTTDGGATWNEQAFSTPVIGNVEWENRDIEVLQNGRIVAVSFDAGIANEAHLFYSDPPYSTWVEGVVCLGIIVSMQLHQTLNEVWLALENSTVALGGLWRSADSGASWTQRWTAVTDLDHNPGKVLYDMRGDILYSGSGGEELVAGKVISLKAGANSSDGAWEKIDQGIWPLIGSPAKLWLCHRGMTEL